MADGATDLEIGLALGGITRQGVLCRSIAGGAKTGE
jgi:hypothetical protein